MLLREHLSYDQAGIITETLNDGKNLFLKGCFIQGDVRNFNERVSSRNHPHQAHILKQYMKLLDGREEETTSLN